MKLEVTKTELKEILYLRTLFLQENNFQIRYNARHERGWTDSYLVTCDGEKIGYGSVSGSDDPKDRDSIFEFYILPSFRAKALEAFQELLKISKVKFVECQTNDLLTTSMLFQYCKNINANTILLKEGNTTNLTAENITFRKRKEDDLIFEHRSEPIGDYVLQLENEIIATGGFLLHYNMPFADLYMEVREDCRKRGYGSFLIQEIKKECYLAGRVPAARTGLDNIASRATLMRAGLKTAGFMLLGEVK